MTTFAETDTLLAEENLEVSRIQDRHREVIRLKSLGLTNKAIAVELDITPAYLSSILGSTLVKRHLARLQDNRDSAFVEAGEQLNSLLPRAVAAYRKVLGEEDVEDEITPMQRVSVASQVFDRTGLGKVSKVETSSLTSVLGPADLAEIRKRTEEALARRESTIVECEEVTNLREANAERLLSEVHRADSKTAPSSEEGPAGKQALTSVSEGEKDE